MSAREFGSPATVRRLRVRGALVACAGGAAVLLAAGPAPANAATKHATSRADLVVKSGTLSVSKGRLVVSLRVKNIGTAKAGASSAAVSTVVAGKAVVLKKVSISSLAAGKSVDATAKVALTGVLATGAHEINMCADQGAALKEKSELNNCLDLGSYAGGKITPSVKPSPTKAPADLPSKASPSPATGGSPSSPGSAAPPPAATPTPTPAPVATTPAPAPSGPTPPQPRPTSTVPTAPLPGFTQGDASTIGTGAAKYWIFVPSSYDASSMTPIRLLVWMHGCYGQSEGDIYDASVGDAAGQNYIVIAPGGEEYGVDPGDGCWKADADIPRIRGMIADVETHFNIDRRRVVLGGYSSGGDTAYRMAFDDAYDTAGVLIENSTPFRDSGVAPSAVNTVFWKFNVVHLAHTGDDTYPIAGVRNETGQLKSAGFPLTLIERPGGHADYPPDGTPPGTVADMRTYLLPHMKDDWLAPAGP